MSRLPPIRALVAISSLTSGLVIGPAAASAEPTPGATPAPPAGEAAAAPEPAPKFELESYQLVLLKRPANPPDYPSEKLEQIQAGHIGHLQEMARQGKLVAAGPFDAQDDPSLRGLAPYRVGSVEEAARGCDAVAR